MKRYILIGLMFMVFSQMTQAQGYKINLTVAGLADTSAILGFHYGSQRLVLDTFQISKKGGVTLAGDEPLPIGLYFWYSPSFYFEFIIKEQQFELKLDKQLGYAEMDVVGSQENTLFRDFQKNMGQYQREANGLIQRLDSVDGVDSLTARSRIAELQGLSDSYRDSIINTYSESFVSSFLTIMKGIKVPDFADETDPMVKKQKQFSYYKTNYFSIVNNYGDLMRTPLFHNYVMKYFDDLVITQADTINKEIDQWLTNYLDDQQGFRYWLVSLSNKYQSSNIMGLDAVTVHLADTYYLTDKVTWMTETAKSDLKKELNFIRPNLIGNATPPLNLVDTALRAFPFSSLKQDYLVLFFYDPECGHCKKKTPELRDAYASIKAEGAEVVAICTITEVDKWKEFIKEFGLTWVNLGDPKNQSNFRADYDVRTTPQLYVLDKERKIIAKKLDVEQVLSFIQNYKLVMDELGEN